MAQKSSIHLDDFSPVISYSPAQDGWQAVFVGTQPPLGAPAANSSHVTSLEGAGLTISWTGTSVALHGASTGPFDVILDNATTQTLPSQSSGILFAQNNMSFRPHTIQLAAHSTVTFTGADVGVDSPPAPPDAGFRTVNPSDWTFSGDWRPTQTDFPDGRSLDANECTDIGSAVSLTFEGAAVHLTGFVSPRGGLYNVTLDSITTVLNASAPWTLETTLFFQTGLDFRRQHTLTVTNAEGNRAMSLRAVAVGDAPPRSPMETPPPSKSVAGLPQGTGIALIVGAVIAFICLLVFIFLIWRHYHRRNQLRRQQQARIKEIVDFSSEYLPPPVPPPSLASARRRPPPLPLSRSSRTTSSLDYDSRVASPELPPSATPSLRMKLAKTLLPHLRDGSSSSGHSGRRSYLRSVNSLSQQYVYDPRDRDDVAFNTAGGDPDAEFRIHDEPVPHDPADDFEIDADAIFNALSKAPPEGHAQRRRRQDASFLEFTNTTSSSEYGTAQSHSARTSSMIRSMTASEITGTDREASSSIPYFTPAARANRRSSLSQTLSFSRAHHQESRPMEMTFPRSKKGVISFAQTVDSDPPKTPSEMVPRSISPPAERRARLEPSPYPQTSSSAMASAGHATPSEQYYSVASGMHTASTSGGDASSGRRGIPSGQSSQFLERHTVSESGRRAIPSGESSQLLDPLAPSSPEVRREPAHHEQSSSFTNHDQLPSSPPTLNPGSPVPSSLNIRGEPSPSTAPPTGPPPPLPHPFSMVGPSAHAGAPPVQVQVLPASPISPGRRSPSPPPWPLPTLTHKERVLRKILGVDSQTTRPPVPDFDR